MCSVQKHIKIHFTKGIHECSSRKLAYYSACWIVCVYVILEEEVVAGPALGVFPFEI